MKFWILMGLIAGSAFCQEIETKPAHIQLSDRLESLLGETTSTQYQARTEIDESDNRVFCDCSGLMCYVLRHDFPEAYVTLKGELAPWKTRPLAATFFETFKRSGPEGDGVWQEIPRLADARPGDLLAWRKRTLKKGSSTGHVCMIGSIPKKQPDGSYYVRTVDSTDKPRTDDTRPAGTNGLGAGHMWFEVNQDGEPKVFWSRVPIKKNTTIQITIGRLLDPERTPFAAKKEDARYLGKSEKEAAWIAKENELIWRVIKRDGKSTPVSMKPNQKRLNAVIEKGHVVRIRRG